MVGRSRVAVISGSSSVGEGFSFESYNSPYVANSGSQVDTLLYHQYHFNGSDVVQSELPRRTSNPKFTSTGRVYPLGRSPSYERAILSCLKDPKPAKKHSRGSSFPQFAMADSNFKKRSSGSRQKSARKPTRTESNSSTCQPESVTSVTSLSSLDSVTSGQQLRRESVRSKSAKSMEYAFSPQEIEKNGLVLSPESLNTDCGRDSPTSSVQETSLPPYSVSFPLGDASKTSPALVHSATTPNGGTSNCPVVHFSNATQTIISIPSFTVVELDNNRG